MYQGNDRCLFFSKMGACRHGDNCTKLHIRPSTSPTVLFPMMYPIPFAALDGHIEDRQWSFTQFDKKYLKKHFEHFYKGVWRTFMEYGRIAELRVVSNLNDHLLGNMYVRFDDAAAASRVVKELRDKKTKYNDIIILPELSPVVNFAEACCKEDLEGTCARGGQCNYLHIMKVSRKLLESLEKKQAKYWKKKEKHDKEDRKRHHGTRSRSNSQPLNGGDICHICGKSGHLSRDCPMK
ncbi:unnamed protein product [Phytomonas sp. Hart1]|nr:unnamed protein product [Phytomonas sp. Hart1]|eukprot:CCW69765.1 unnamed protein product [Phytomonas sp. isolate Hart1]